MRYAPEAEAKKSTLVSAREAAAQSNRLVILGAPGGGKSTFVRQLLAQLIQARLEGKPAPVGLARDLFPLLTVLRELAQRLQTLDLTGLSDEARAEALVACLQSQWEADLQRFQGADLADHLTDALTNGQVLLVFDGLDEMAPATRPLVRLALAALLRHYPTIARVIVTCRVRSYVEGATLPGFTPYTLADFSEGKINDFVAAWYQAQVDLGRLTRDKAAAQVADLQAAALRPALRTMAANPMLLTTMALIHQKQTRLPEQRVRLYAEAVKVLLNRWQESKGIAPSPALTAFLQDEQRVQPLLERLAYEAHRQVQKETADLPRTALLGLLDELFAGDLALANEFLDYADHRAGLLVGQGGGEGTQPPPLQEGWGGGKQRPQSYTFPHRTFQEYLAGCYLLTGQGNQRGVGRTYRQHAALGDMWQLAAELGAEELFYNRRGESLLLDLMYELCPVTPPQDATGWRALLWSGKMATLLAQEKIAQDSDRPEGDQAYLDRLIPRLLAIMRASPLNAVERADAGRVLAKLGDPRIEVLDPLQMEWCEIPAGPFIMGSAEDDPYAHDREKPQHIFNIPYTYCIARYPVTNAQFRFFIDAGGYHYPPYWVEAKQQGYWVREGFKSNSDERLRTAPYALGDPYDLPNYPVVGVSWYEALAFTRWLTERLQATVHSAPERVVRLPTEAEREKAARGDNGQRYPWLGDKSDPNLANYDETGIGSTCALGVFPSGRSPYGVEEMASHVWEWCSTGWLDDYTNYGLKVDEALTTDVKRVIRGGAFAFSDFSVRTTARAFFTSYYGNIHGGFRVVLAPITLASVTLGNLTSRQGV
ncbi:MAG: SUMF1/EgtB/PvdO family nonheme iron enzyme [Caldilineaceae bacterium]